MAYMDELITIKVGYQSLDTDTNKLKIERNNLKIK
jgi:hypothetical protein